MAFHICLGKLCVQISIFQFFDVWEVVLGEWLWWYSMKASLGPQEGEADPELALNV